LRHGEAQLRSVQEQNLAEECRLRARDLELHGRVMTLTQENSRLETQRRFEQQQLSRNNALIEELEGLIGELRFRKSQFEHGSNDAQKKMRESHDHEEDDGHSRRIADLRRAHDELET